MNKNNEQRTVAALFTREDSIYGEIEGVDSWPRSRDARQWPGGAPVVAHPPCRAWGYLRRQAKPAPGEKELAPWAVEKVRQWGGVLEHPQASQLWEYMGIARPGRLVVDIYGGWSISVDQYWWGHKAQKRTWLYIVGIDPKDVAIPLALGDAPQVVCSNTAYRAKARKAGKKLRPELSKSDRERTPPAFAQWLVDIARRTKKNV